MPEYLTGTMHIPDISTLDPNLAADIGANTVSDWVAYIAEADGSHYHVVFWPEVRRGGIVLVGNGSNGITHWTDASTADEVLSRYLTDNMTN